jgi:hypothetical protein
VKGTHGRGRHACWWTRWRGELGVGQRVLEEEPRLAPVALHRALRYAAHGGDLLESVPAEEVEVDQLRQRRLEGAKLVARPPAPRSP